MKPDFTFNRIIEGVHLLPMLSLSWASEWRGFEIHAGWLFWYVEIEWPIE